MFTPALLQLVAKLPWRYWGSPSERGDSFLYCRVNMFASQAAFSSSGRLIRVGDPVCGFVEPTSGDASSAQATGWDICDPAVWKMSAPASAPAVFELNPNALFRLPQMAAGNFLYVRFPKTNYAYIAAPPPAFGSFTQLYVPPQTQAVTRGRSAVRDEGRGKSLAPPRVRKLSADIDGPHASNWPTHTPAAILVGNLLSQNPFLCLIFPGSNMGETKMNQTASYRKFLEKKRRKPSQRRKLSVFVGIDETGRKLIVDDCGLRPLRSRSRPHIMMVSKFFPQNL